MKEMNNDILRDSPELKKLAHSVPEGYFDSLKAELKRIPENNAPVRKRQSFWWWAAAAAIAIIISAGGIIANLPEKDSVVGQDQYANANTLTEDEIIEYLIYSGVEVEEIIEY